MVNCAAGRYLPVRRLPRWDVPGNWDVPGAWGVPGAWDVPGCAGVVGARDALRRRYSSSKAPV